MNRIAIKNFAIWARWKLISYIIFEAGIRRLILERRGDLAFFLLTNRAGGGIMMRQWRRYYESFLYREQLHVFLRYAEVI